MGAIPCMVYADKNGNIYDDPDLLMCCRKGSRWGVPTANELVPLPEESELMLLPDRMAVGLDNNSGKLIMSEGYAVGAFAAPGYTLSSHPLYHSKSDAKMLPLFAYGAVGYADGHFWICAKKVDKDSRQQFKNIKKSKLMALGEHLKRKFPRNRLLQHIINNCARRYSCPAAKNFILGRYEAPLPTSRVCNARCLGCISSKTDDSPLVATPQCRLAFTPTVSEIAEIMRIHSQRENRQPILSFGQGCEGDPLINWELIAESIADFRNWQKKNLNYGVTVNCNTNASLPAGIEALAKSGLSSIRVSLNSSLHNHYHEYYRPVNYAFEDVEDGIHAARDYGLYISFNLLYFPGITDTEEELESIAKLITKYRINMIQWRNLNIDPDWYNKVMANHIINFVPLGGMGLAVFMKRLKKMCAWLNYGYFNPYIGDRFSTFCG